MRQDTPTPPFFSLRCLYNIIFNGARIFTLRELFSSGEQKENAEKGQHCHRTNTQFFLMLLFSVLLLLVQVAFFKTKNLLFAEIDGGLVPPCAAPPAGASPLPPPP